MEGLFAEDQQHDTLLYIGEASVLITDWFFLKDKADLSSIELNNFLVNTYRKNAIWNYQYIVDAFEDTSTKKNKNKGIEFSLKYILLQNGIIKQKDEWLGVNQNIQFTKFELKPTEINFDKKIVNIDWADIINPQYTNYAYSRLKPLQTPIFEIPKTGKTYYQLFGWKLQANKINIKNGMVSNDVQTKRLPYKYFDGQHFQFSDIDAKLNKIKWLNDTVSLTAEIDAKEKCGFEVNKFKSSILAYPNTINFNNLNIITPNSSLSNFVSFSFNDFNNDISDFINKINIKANFLNSKISPKDVAYFAPVITDIIKSDVLITGNIEGTVSDFDISKANIKYKNSNLIGNYTMKGLPNINTTFMQLTDGNISTSINDISDFAPQLKTINGVDLNKLGTIHFNGDYKGYYNDFYAKGFLQTDLGNVDADLKMTLLPNVLPTYNGTIITSNFGLGKLIKIGKLGNIGFNGKIDGKGFDIKNIEAYVNGTTTKLEYNNYTYTNITTIGKIVQKSFDGSIKVNDENLIATANGKINFNNEKPILDLEANIEKSDFKKLQFINENYSLTGKVKLNSKGITLKDIEGGLTLDNASIIKDGKPLPFSFLKLNTLITPLGRSIDFASNEFDGNINGQFHLNSIVATMQNVLNKYYPTLFKKSKEIEETQNFDFVLNTKNVIDYVRLISKDITGLNNASFRGNLNTKNDEVNIFGKIPLIIIKKDYKVDNLSLQINSLGDSLNINALFDNITIKDSLKFSNNLVKINTQNNLSNFNIQSIGDNLLNKFDANGRILVFNDGVQINFDPSSFTINNTIWNLNQNGELILRNNKAFANDLKFVHNNQEIVISTMANSETATNDIVANVKNIEINDYTSIFVKGMKLNGQLNGNIFVTDPLGKPQIRTEGIITDFERDNDSIGKIELTGTYDVATNNVDYTAKSDNKNYLFDLVGRYYPKDTLRTPIYNKIKLNGTNISILETFLSSVFKDIKGTATGDLEFFGTAKEPFLVGNVQIDNNLEMLVKYTNVKYILPKPIITFNPREIDFSNIVIQDTLKNKGHITVGKVLYDGLFKNIGLDVSLRTDTMLLLNTNRNLNSTFYGTAIADAKMKLYGKIDNKLKMDVIVNDPKKAKLYLNTSSSGRTLGKADFIEFKTYGKELGTSKLVSNSSFSLNLIVNANPNAEVNVILDELAGDNIRAIGNGLLNIGFEDNEIKMNGTYVVDEGDYTFSLQSWFKKPFKIEKGSTINWNGNPYDAKINISANYLAKNVSLNELLYNASSSNSTNLTSNLNVSANLTEKLASPKIKFDISYPDNQTKDLRVEKLLDVVRRDESELNKQVAFLILFDRLLPISSNNSNYGVNMVSNTIYNTISGLLTAEANNAINKLLSNKFGNNIKANIDFKTYTPGQLVATQNSVVPGRATSSFGISTSWLNERLVFYINGNIDFNLLSANQSSFSVLPNLIMEYKIVPNGTVVGTFFYKQFIDALSLDASGGKKTSAGGGIAWRKESDDIWDFFRSKKKKKILSKN